MSFWPRIHKTNPLIYFGLRVIGVLISVWNINCTTKTTQNLTIHHIPFPTWVISNGFSNPSQFGWKGCLPNPCHITHVGLLLHSQRTSTKITITKYWNFNQMQGKITPIHHEGNHKFNLKTKLIIQLDGITVPCT